MVKGVRVAFLGTGVPSKLTYKLATALPEPLLEANLIRIRSEADRLFGEILDDCRREGRTFPAAANTAFRKRDSGEPRGCLEQKILSLFNKIEALEILNETKG